MKNNLKKIENYKKNTGIKIVGLATATNPTNQGLALEKLGKRLSFINLFLLKFEIINFLIITYFYMQQDIIFQATGWFSIPENIHWYNICLVAIIVRIIILLTTHYLREYIKYFSLWTEKEKKNALTALAGINLLTLTINFPLIGGFYAYMKGNEILSNNWFFGTFRRILNANERAKLSQETVQNFLEKTEASKEIKEQLKNWAIENSESILGKYDDGSVFATKYLAEKLEMQKEFLQLEKMQKELSQLLQLQKNNQAISSSDLVDQGFFPWIYEQTIHGFNYFNPFVTDAKTCAIAWGLLLGTGLILLAVSKSNLISWNEIKTEETSSSGHEVIYMSKAVLKATREAAVKRANDPVHQQLVNKLQRVLTDRKVKQDTIKTDTYAVLQETHDQLHDYQIVLNNISVSINQKLDLSIQEEISEAQEQIMKMIEKMRTSTGYIPPYANISRLSSENNILSQETKNEILRNIFKKHESQHISIIEEMTKEIINNL